MLSRNVLTRFLHNPDIDFGDDNDNCSDFIDGKRNYEQYVKLKTARIQPSQFNHNMSILISLIATCRYEKQRWSWKSRRPRQLSNCKRSFVISFIIIWTALLSSVAKSKSWKQYRMHKYPHSKVGKCLLKSLSVDQCVINLWWFQVEATIRSLEQAVMAKQGPLATCQVIILILILIIILILIMTMNCNDDHDDTLMICHGHHHHNHYNFYKSLSLILPQTRIQQRRLRPGAEFCHDEVFRCHRCYR